MNRKRIIRKVEMKFWDTVTPLMDTSGPILKTKKAIYKTLHSKTGFLASLLFVWSAVGFVSGLLIGKLISIFPL